MDEKFTDDEAEKMIEETEGTVKHAPGVPERIVLDFKDGEGGRTVDPVDASVGNVRRRVCVAGSAGRGAVCPVLSPLSVPLCPQRSQSHVYHQEFQIWFARL